MWTLHQAFGVIPDALQNATFSQPVSRTPYWLANGNPLANYPWQNQPDATLPESAEVVVIGAGFTGGALAYHWAKALSTEKQMVVLEMDDPASGASGRNAGEGKSLKPNVTFSTSTIFMRRFGTHLHFGSDETRIPDRQIGRNQPSRFITKYLIGELHRVCGWFPLRVTHEWSGTVGFTYDEYPIVGLMDGQRQFIIAGMSGSGSAVSFNAARCICNRILGNTSESDDYPEAYFSPTRLLSPESHCWPAVEREG